MDEQGPIDSPHKAPIHRPAPLFTEQGKSQEILVTGIKVVDLLAPYAKGGKSKSTPPNQNHHYHHYYYHRRRVILYRVIYLVNLPTTLFIMPPIYHLSTYFYRPLKKKLFFITLSLTII